MTGAPGSAETNSRYGGVTNVTIPTMTTFPRKGENTGVSMLVFPGGGFRVLAMSMEGTETCGWIVG